MSQPDSPPRTGVRDGQAVTAKRPVTSVFGVPFFVVFFLLATLMLTLLPSTLVCAWADEETAQEGENGPSVEVVEITPAILKDEDEVTVKVRLKGFAKGEESARLVAFVRADPFVSSDEVEKFLVAANTEGWSAGETMLTEDTLTQASRKEGVIVELELPSQGLPLWNPLAWGVYGVDVMVLGLTTTEEVSQVPQASSLLLWHPPDSQGAVRVNTLLSSSATDLDQAIDFLPKEVGATWRVNPTQLGEITSGAVQPLDPLEVMVAPPGDADISILALGDNDVLLNLALRGQAEAEEKFSAEKPKNVSLVEGTILASPEWLTQTLLVKADGRPVLSGPKGVVTLVSREPSPSSLFLANVETGETVSGEISYFQPSLQPKSTPVLSSWATGYDLLTEPIGEGEGERFLRDQKLRASTALVANSIDALPSPTWINLTDASLDANLAHNLQVLFEVPWVEKVTLQETLDSIPCNTPRMPVVNRYPANYSLMRADLELLSEQYSKASYVAQAAPEPKEVMAPIDRAVLRAVAANLDSDERAERMNTALELLEEEADSVAVAPSRNVNVMGRNAPFPVTVTNSGPQPVEVDVGLVPSDARLQVKQRVRTVIPAEGSVTLHVPVVAVGTGSLEVTADVASIAGKTLATSPEIHVRLLADWEDRGTWFVGSVVALLFIYGLFRTLRKGRRQVVLTQGGRAHERKVR